MYTPNVDDRVEWTEVHKGVEELRRGVVTEILDGAVRVRPNGLKNTKRVDLEDIVQPQVPTAGEAEFVYEYTGGTPDLAGAEGNTDPVARSGDAQPEQSVAEPDAPVALAPIEPRVIQIQQMDPASQIRAWEEIATPLADIIREKKLTVKISGREHVMVEGWTIMMAMLNVFPTTEWTRQITDTEGAPGWEARVVWKTHDGRMVAAGEGQCTRSERMWSKRDDFALRAMAQTRATGRGARQSFSFIIQLAGYSPTPEEEMPGDMPRVPDPAPARPPQGGTPEGAGTRSPEIPVEPAPSNPVAQAEPETTKLSAGKANTQKDIKALLRCVYETCQQRGIPIAPGTSRDPWAELTLDANQCACVGIRPNGITRKGVVRIGRRDMSTDPWSWEWPAEDLIRDGLALHKRQLKALLDYDPDVTYDPVDPNAGTDDVPF